MTKKLFAFLLILLPTTGVAQVKAYAIYKEGVMTFCCDDKMPDDNYCWEAGDTAGPHGSYMPGWHYTTSVIFGTKKVVFDASFTQARPKSCKGWFQGMENLKEIVTIGHLNTSECTSMEAMFKDCKSLTYIDIGGLSTWNVKSMFQMFRGCSELEKIFIYGISTENVVEMDKMFSECEKLTSLNLGTFNTEKVRKMPMMFYNCKELRYILIYSTWNTDNVTMSDKMFEGCGKLKGQDGSMVGDVVDKTYAHAGIGGYMRNTLPVEADVKTIKRSTTNPTPSYSLDGKRLSTPQHGLNIVRTSEGKIKKVVVK